MSYKLSRFGTVVRSDGSFIPADPANTDYAAYLAWLSEGNTPEPADQPPPAPIAPISPRQIRQALTRVGLRAAVETAVAAGDQDLKDWWEFSTSFERLNPQVTAMALALAVTDTQLDDLWALGASL